MAPAFDLLVLGDVNPDLVLRGGDVVPAFGQAEHLVDEAMLTVGGSGAIMACAAARLASGKQRGAWRLILLWLPRRFQLRRPRQPGRPFMP